MPQNKPLPYEPRRRPPRPDRALPNSPKGNNANEKDEHDPEDIETVNAFDDAQFTSPPSPPPSTKGGPVPPNVAGSGSNVNPATLGTSSKQPGAGAGAGAAAATSTAKTSAAHLHPYINALPSSANGVKPPTTLTPLRAHYLKKTLVTMQLAHELNLLTDPVLGANALGLLGEPFTLPEAAKREAMSRVSEISRQEGRVGDMPFLRFLFHQFVLPFPFLTSAPPTFWSAKVQPFLTSFLSSTGYTKTTSLTPEEQKLAESLMTKEERKEMAERLKLWDKVEKHSALMVGVGVKIAGGEEVVRIGQTELRRLEDAQMERRRKLMERQRAQWGAPPPPPGQGQGGASEGQYGQGQGPPQQLAFNAEGAGFDVNVIGVRVVNEKGRVRNKSHEEFLIRTKRPGIGDVYVSRRYGDFRRLSEELRRAFPDYPIPLPPPKDKTASAAPVAQQPQYGYYNPMRMIYGSGAAPPSSSQGGSGSSSPYGNSPNTGSTGSFDAAPGSPTGATTPLSREKNRLTLRVYLQAILSMPYIINSPVLRSFLLSSPTTLSPSEAADCQRRLEGDAVREEGRRRFREEAEKRIDALREGLSAFKGEVLSKEGGLKGVFEVVRRVEKVEDLPKAEASVLEWGKISLAATIFQVYVAADTAQDSLASTKRLHGLMPYFVLKGILRISNPMAMIRGVLDLFLARPFGGQSLLQRMFSSSLTEDVRAISEDIMVVQEKIDDPVLCQKVEAFAYAPWEIQEIYRKDAASEHLDLLVVILRSPDVPVLARPQFQRVFRASRAYKEYQAHKEELSDSDDDVGPDNEDAWLFEDLNILLKLYTRKREKEALLALIFEGVTAELLKDIITIFYSPLAQVYKAASIADSLGDLQNFLNDMIRTVEQVEELSQEDPARTVQTFIDLVERHQQSFYTFVHNVHSKGQGLFDALMEWIELFLSYARDGLPKPVDLEIILPAGGAPREAVMAEVDLVAQYHYRLKIAHEEKVRRRFDRDPNVTERGGEAEERALLESVMASLDLNEATTEGAEYEESDDDLYVDDDEGDGDIFEDAVSETSSVAGDRAGAQGGLGVQQPVQGGSGRPSMETERLPPPKLSVNPPVPEADDKPHPGAPLSTPDHIDPNLPSLANLSLDHAHGKKGGSARPSLDKARGKGGNAKKGGNASGSGGVQSQDRSPRIYATGSPRPGQQGSAGQGGQARRRKRKVKTAEILRPPETKAIDELRPLFVEVIKPLLRVKPLKR